jgi:hypothetical protein
LIQQGVSIDTGYEASAQSGVALPFPISSASQNPTTPSDETPKRDELSR